MIEKGGGRGSGISVLMAREDDGRQRKNDHNTWLYKNISLFILPWSQSFC